MKKLNCTKRTNLHIVCCMEMLVGMINDRTSALINIIVTFTRL